MYEQLRQQRGLTLVGVLLTVTLATGLAAMMSWSISQGIEMQRKAEVRQKISRIGQAARQYWLMKTSLTGKERWPGSTKRLVETGLVSRRPFDPGDDGESPVIFDRTGSDVTIRVNEYKGRRYNMSRTFEIPDAKNVSDASVFGSGQFAIIRAGGYGGPELLRAIDKFRNEFEPQAAGAYPDKLGWPTTQAPFKSSGLDDEVTTWDGHENFVPPNGDDDPIQIMRGASRGNFFMVNVIPHKAQKCPFSWKAGEVVEELVQAEGGNQNQKKVRYWRPGFYYEGEDATLDNWIFGQEKNYGEVSASIVQNRVENYPSTYQKAKEAVPDIGGSYPAGYRITLREKELKLLMDNNCFHAGQLARFLTTHVVPIFHRGGAIAQQDNPYLGRTLERQRRFILERVME